MLYRIQRKFALSRQGAKDLLKACISCVISNISLMMPVGLLYKFVGDLMEDNNINIPLYVIGVVLYLALIFITYGFQYNATFLATYIETGVRRVTLAERLRKIPLSFLGKKDLSDLTNTMMADCTTLETSFSHYIPEFIGSVISTVIISVCLFAFDWKMALAAVWVVPVSFAIVFFSTKVQDSLNQKQMAAKLACADGIQECLEAVRDHYVPDTWY